MLIVLCLLAFSGLGSCIEKTLPTRYEIESSINRTIEEVERLIQHNPSLPKLSRNDIVNILLNITMDDMKSRENEALKAVKNMRSDYMRALMVVLPYNAKDSSQSLNELYTKPPMVQILPDSEDSNVMSNVFQYQYNEGKTTESYEPNEHADQTTPKLTTHDYVTTPRPAYQEPTKPVKETMRPYQNKKTTIPSVQSYTENDNLHTSPEKFSFDLTDFGMRMPSTQINSRPSESPVRNNGLGRYRTSTESSNMEIIYGSSVTPSAAPVTDMTTSTTTTKAPPRQNVLTSDQWQYFAPPASTRKPHRGTAIWRPLLPESNPFITTLRTTTSRTPERTVTSRRRVTLKPTAEVFKKATARNPSIFVTPNEVTNSKANMRTTMIPGGFSRAETSTSSPMRGEVQDLLKSIGLRPIDNADLNANLQDINIHKNLIDSPHPASGEKHDVQTPPSIKISSSALTSDNTFASPAMDYRDGMKNLSPDMQLLFERFGLHTSNKALKFPLTTPTTTTTTTTTTESTINLFKNFKRIPNSPVKDDEMRDFLAKFGLGNQDMRGIRAMSPKFNERPSIIEAVPNHMKKILENIGLITNSRKNVSPPRLIDNDLQASGSSKLHVFKPHESAADIKEQKGKIQELLNTVRLVQEGKADVSDVQRVANELLHSTSLENGPDPVKLAEILKIYQEDLKNEVKRQQKPEKQEVEETTLSSMATTEALTSTSSTTTTTTTTSTTAAPDTTIESDEKSADFKDSDSSSSSAMASAVDSSASASFDPTTTMRTYFFDTIDLSKYNISTTESPNLTDLEDSFGGSTAEPDPVLPTRPKSGLYFLVDWNSFLEVGVDDKDKINLRFEPKFGDPSRFISVKIP